MLEQESDNDDNVMILSVYTYQKTSHVRSFTTHQALTAQQASEVHIPSDEEDMPKLQIPRNNPPVPFTCTTSKKHHLFTLNDYPISEQRNIIHEIIS